MLIYRNKLRFFVEFCLVFSALMTFFNSLLSLFLCALCGKKEFQKNFQGKNIIRGMHVFF